MTNTTTTTTPDDRRAFNKSLRMSDTEHRASLIASNDAFIAAMARASIKGKEKVVPGTFVDTTPPIHAIRIRGEAPYSACGSPSAMCMDTGARGGGTETLR